jgi:DNA-binding MarR family transcriptional regulator
MTVTARPVTGQDINLAARATRKALELLLAEQGASFPPLATMNAIVARGGSVQREELVRVLASALDVEAQTVAIIVHGLQTRGLVRDVPSTSDGTPHVELTPAGSTEHQRLSAIIGGLTDELYRDFGPDDLATTRRVLVTLTERAEGRVAASLS